MIIGVPKEIKTKESRVALTPAGVVSFVQQGHEVLIERDAGFKSGFTNESYVAAGATILDNVSDVWAKADMVMKVKERSAYTVITTGMIRPAWLLVLSLKSLVKLGMDTPY